MKLAFHQSPKTDEDAFSVSAIQLESLNLFLKLHKNVPFYKL